MLTRRFSILASVLVALLLLGSAADAEARKRRSKKKRVVALFPLLTRDDPDAAVVAGVEGLLSKASALIDNLVVVSGKPLKKKLRKDPGKLIDACGSSLKCISKLGKKARAVQVLLARAQPDEGGVKIMFLLIDVKLKNVAGKNTLSFNGVGDVKPVLGGSFFQIFGITDPGKLEVVGATGVIRIDGEIVGKGKGPHSVPPGRHEVVVNGKKQMVMISPNKTKSVNADDGEPTGDEPMVVASAEPPPPPEPAGAPEPPSAEPEYASTSGESNGALALLPLDSGPDDSDSYDDSSSMDGAEVIDASEGSDGLDLAALPPGATSAPPPPRRDEGLSPGLLTWVGAGVAVGGLALGGIGGFMMADGAGQSTSVQEDKTQTQLSVAALHDGATSTHGTGMILMIAGIGTAVAGATLATLDLFVFKPKKSVSVGVGVASVSMRVAW